MKAYHTLHFYRHSYSGCFIFLYFGCMQKAASTPLASATSTDRPRHKDILFGESLDAVIALLQPAPELARLLLLFLIIREANVGRNRRRRVIKLLKELTVSEINFGHFFAPFGSTPLKVRGQSDDTSYSLVVLMSRFSLT